MYVKKRMSLLLFAALAMVLFTACGRWDFSREAAKAANEAQNAVVFEASATLAQSLKDALEDKVQISDVKAAMEADERLDDLLGRLDVYAVESDDAEAAAQTIAEGYIKGRVSGRQSDGSIAMVKADNGWFYAAVVTTTGGSGSSSGSGSGSGSGSDDGNGGTTPTPDPDPEPEPEPAPDPVLENVTVVVNSGTYYADHEFVKDELTVTAEYDNDTSTVLGEDDYEITSTSVNEEGNQATITITYEGETYITTVDVTSLKVESFKIYGLAEQTYYKGDNLLYEYEGLIIKTPKPRDNVYIKLVYNSGNEADDKIYITNDMLGILGYGATINISPDVLGVSLESGTWGESVEDSVTVQYWYKEDGKDGRWLATNVVVTVHSRFE